MLTRSNCRDGFFMGIRIRCYSREQGTGNREQAGKEFSANSFSISLCPNCLGDCCNF
ncbi:hypothetical protein PL9214510092 [Planktothrix tepida PCC 9214]|uniref:Uncharacterized protein n=1 Tax=Planktothrix tepida PCC 9214 TaxID=671072 RepID=A0A1J1LLS0_9CYAN|nr:hypothetical protein PL9214510092 [Planktothrix tepida PCC 9214]